MRVVLISGKIGSGKDTTAGILTRLLKDRGYNVFPIAFADPIKKAAAFLSGEEVGVYYTREGKDGNIDTKDTRRRLIVAIGEGATGVDPHIFARFTLKAGKEQIGNTKKSILLITDLRKKAELEHVEDNEDTYIVRLKGSFEPTKNEELAKAPIECELDYLDDYITNQNAAWYDNAAILKLRCTIPDRLAEGEKEATINRQRNLELLAVTADSIVKRFDNK